MPSEAAGCRPAEIKADWIAALDRRLGWRDLPRSYRLLNAVLHALDVTVGERPIKRCGRAWEDAAFDRSEAADFLGRVATGFKPDCLDNPEGAVLVVIEVLDEVIHEPGFESIRDALVRFAGPTLFNHAAIKWSRFRDSFVKEYLR